MNLDLTYAEATANVEKVLTQGGFAKARVSIARHRGRRFVVKDFGSKGFWERNLIGRMVIRREFSAYRVLAGIDGLLSTAKRLTPFSLAVEYLDGVDLGGLTRGDLGRGVIEQVERIVDDLHSRGWVHLDLQRRSNILLVKGKVFVVDLASAFHPGGIPLIGRGLTRFLGFFDWLSLIKLKNIYAPESLTETERKWLRIRNLVMPTKW